MAFLAPFAAWAGTAIAGAGAAASTAGTAAAAGFSALTTSQMVALGLTAVSGVMGAKAQYDEGKIEDRLHQENAAYAEVQAKDAVARGVVEQDKVRLQLRRILGAQRARYGAGGIDLSAGGTPTDVALDSEREATLDMLTISNNAAREAFGYRTKARNERTSGRLARKSGKSNAFGTVLTTGAQAYGIFKAR